MTRIVAEFHQQLDIFSDDALQHVMDIVDSLVNADHFYLHHLPFAERKQLARQSSRTRSGVLDLGNEMVERGILLQVGAQHAAVAAHDGHQIVEVVRHAAG